MKRSEMIEKLSDFLDFNYNLNDNSASKEIIDFMEHCGMVGPKYNINDRLTGRQKEIATKLSPEGFMVHGWEPEDEKCSDNGNT